MLPAHPGRVRCRASQASRCPPRTTTFRLARQTHASRKHTKPAREIGCSSLMPMCVPNRMSAPGHCSRENFQISTTHTHGRRRKVGFWETVLITFFGMAFHHCHGSLWRGQSQFRAPILESVLPNSSSGTAIEASGTHRRLAMEVVVDMKLGKIVKQSGFIRRGHCAGFRRSPMACWPRQSGPRRYGKISSLA